MASTAASVKEAAAQLPRKFGTKQVFLPNHVIAFIRPKPKQPPNLATFAVPLQFNKLDLRDYLYHAYNVEVNAVRSFINQPLPKRKGGTTGKWYRPRSKKMMIAELVKPFVWPDPPAEDQREGFDYPIFKKMYQAREEHYKRQSDPSDIPLRTRKRVPKDREVLKAQAEEFLKNQAEWTNGRKGEDKWTEVEKDVSI
ncbi:mitochondrial 54S ribosomal protein YmL41 [Madurella fahalii]|uniref:Large ribosomal subunit protein uL23m n=1 Tax=Madurella fahalii TaxID=1157608 RepID=A0ABQ0GMK9_9PEZI